MLKLVEQKVSRLTLHVPNPRFQRQFKMLGNFISLALKYFYFNAIFSVFSSLCYFSLSRSHFCFATLLRRHFIYLLLLTQFNSGDIAVKIPIILYVCGDLTASTFQRSRECHLMKFMSNSAKYFCHYLAALR